MMGRMINRARALAVVAGGVLVTSSPALAGDVAAGKALYDKQCKVCHSVAGDAGKKAELGGPLDGVGAKRDEAWLRAYLTDPKAKIPDAKMPKMKLTDQQLDDEIAYMLSLVQPAPAQK